MALPRKLKLFNVFLDGNHYQGQAVAITLPKLTSKVEAYRAGGMMGEVDVDLGLEKLELEHTYGGIMPEIFKQFGLANIDGAMVRFSGSYQRDDTGETDAVDIVMRGRHTEIDGGESKSGDDTEFKVKSSLTYYKLTINGADVVEIDMLNTVFKVDGQDRYAQHRKNIGL
ncbi:phage tail protein [Pasteurellaceae bacterium Macca]|nr:phage tail protein [Pasteurellaceae bacterium Macca]